MSQHQRLFWAYEQLYGGRELHMFKNLATRNAWVNEHSGIAENFLNHRDFPSEKDFDNAAVIVVHGEDGAQVSRTYF